MFGPLGNILGSVANIGGLQNVLGIASLVFPQAAIANAAINLITQGVGQAVNQAAQQLVKDCGMPKFLQDIIGDVVKDVLKNICKPQNPECEKACQDKAGGSLRDLIDDLTKSIVDNAKRIMEQGGDEKCEGGGKGGKKAGAGSWLVAIARAMGEAAGAKAERLVELSNKINDLTTKGGSQEEQAAAAKEASALQAEFQAESQMFSMLQSAFSNAIKSIGEGMGQMARKG